MLRIMPSSVLNYLRLHFMTFPLYLQNFHPLSTIWQIEPTAHATAPTLVTVMLCLATMHIRQSCSTCDIQLACLRVIQFQLRHCAAESPTKSPLQQATEAAAKKQADPDKPQAAAPGAAAAAAADKPQAAAAAAPNAILFETEATPSAQDGPGEAPSLHGQPLQTMPQRHRCDSQQISALTDCKITSCMSAVASVDLGEGAMNTGIHRLRLAHIHSNLVANVAQIADYISGVMVGHLTRLSNNAPCLTWAVMQQGA
jgi:hypothetical protein